MKEMMRSYINTKQDNWDILLPLLQFALNTAVNETIGYTPFFLEFGQRAVLPLEVHWDVVNQSSKKTMDYVKELRSNMKYIFQLVREKVGEAQHENREKSEEKAKERNLIKVGDLVVVKTEMKLKGLNRKLLPRYRRAIYKVIERPNEHCVKVWNIVTNRPIAGYVNVSRVKKYHTVTAEDVNVGWEVSKILAARETGGEREYLVRWDGFTERSNQWITEEELDAPQLVNEYSELDSVIRRRVRRIFWNEPDDEEH